MVNFGTDLVVMGGNSNGSDSSAFYQLSAENGKLKWEKMKPELKKPRTGFVAMTIPDYFLVDTEKTKSKPQVRFNQAINESNIILGRRTRKNTTKS